MNLESQILCFFRKRIIHPEYFEDSHFDSVLRLIKDSKQKNNNYKNLSKNSLVIFNSSRLKANKLEIAIKNYERLFGLKSKHLTFLDVHISFKSFFRLQSIHIFTLLNGLKNLHKIIFNLNRLKYFIPWVVKLNLDIKKYSRIYLFTSNSRSVETYRVIGLKSGIHCVEFIHGITSDIFDKYLFLLEMLAQNYDSSMKYINILPNLPQSETIEKNLVKLEGKQIFFRNEEAWVHSNRFKYDVLIVGGNSSSKVSYEQTIEFKRELNSIDELLREGLSCIYCPHPNNRGSIEKFLPDNIQTSTVPQSINSSKIAIGNYSTVLFSAALLEKKVFVYQDSYELIPDNLKKLLGDTKSCIYSLKRVLLALSKVSLKTDAINLNGIDILEI